MADPRVKVVLDAENNTTAALREAQVALGQLSSAAQTFESALQAIGAMEIARQFGDMVKQSIEFGDQLSKLSQKAGMSVEFLSGLTYAARIADVEFDQLQKGLKFLNKEISDAASGGEAAATFTAIGIAVRDASGQIRPTSDILLDVADKFSKTQDSANKTAVALKLFGRSGQEMIPMLNEGKAGIEDLMKQAEALGVTMSTETARASEQVADEMKALSAEVQGAALQFAAGLLPSLASTAQAFIGVGNSGAQALGQIAGAGLQLAVGTWVNLGYAVQKAYTYVELMAAKLTDDKGQIAEYAQELHSLERDRQDFMNRLFAEPNAPHVPPSATATGTFNLGGGKSLFVDMAHPPTLPKTDPQLLAEATSWVNALTAGDKQLRDMLSIPSPFVTWAEQAKDLGDQVQISFQDMQIGEEQVRAAVARGDLDQMTGAQKIIELHKEWAASVQQILPEYERLAALTGDQGLQMNVKGLAAQVEDLSRESSALGMHLKGVLVDDMSRAFADWISGTTSAAAAFRRMAQDIIGQLVEIIAKMVLVKALQGIGGGLFGGIGHLLGFAEGGPFQAGVPFLAGEQGPELIVPSVGGTVLNQAQLGMNPQGAGGNVTVHINAPGADADAARRIEGVARQLRAEMPLYAAATFKEMRRRGVNF